jgi:hypothetical protein
VKVALTTVEIIKYGTMGVTRCANALDKGRTGAHGFNRDDDRWNIDVEGVLCEYAAAKALGIKYDPVVDGLDTHLGDLGPRLQVRGTKYNRGNLLIHDKDADRDKFMLVTGALGVYTLRGWVYGEDGKHQKFVRWDKTKTRWAYWVGQEWLKPVESYLAAP